MEIVKEIQAEVKAAVDHLYEVNLPADSVLINLTKKEFEGEYTVVVFPISKQIRKAPEITGNEIGAYLKVRSVLIAGFNTIKGFLNLSLTDDFWRNTVTYLDSKPDYWKGGQKHEKVLVEFSSPNTNKPLHLGHIRNILLGWSCSKILKAAGYEVIKTQIVNDRGIAICKSMLAWQKFGENSTPESTGIKGDHFVGNWYVRFDSEFQKEYKEWQNSSTAQKIYETENEEQQSKDSFYKSFRNRYFNQYSSLGEEAKEMLLRWESNESGARSLWNQMNDWVYIGLNETYDRLGVSFDYLYYESDTYLLGKETIDSGLNDGTFYRKADGSVWVDLDDVGLDQKVLLRSDGTSVYMTQDLGTAIKRYEDFRAEKMVYVVADEQNYHFKALFEIMKKMDAPFAHGLYHLSYGMVDLPEGRMKSREGTVVDADDLIDEVIFEAKEAAAERGEIEQVDVEERERITQMIGLAALKFFIIKVDPRKRMTFDPKESVDMQGQTGPYIQNAYVRIRSILRRKSYAGEDFSSYTPVLPEKALIAEILNFSKVVQQSAKQYDPSNIANFAYSIAKDFHRYYHEYRILNAESDAAIAFRLNLISHIAHIIKEAMELLGIEMPEKM
jgi:arginyl-tRNA synthetase